ncbi:MAG TPA: hypothetical protein VIR30_07665 [Nocardioides sp.]
MVAFLPGFFRAWWNLTDPEQRSLISPTSVMVMKILLAAVFIPFLVAVVSLVVARLRERSWRQALGTAAAWTAGSGVVVFCFVAITGGGA